MILATPESFSWTLWILAGIELPVQSFAAYCILCKTPAIMDSVKVSMFNLYFWAMALDFALTCLVQPIVLLPSITVCPMGLLQWFGVPAVLQAYLVVTLWGATGVSVVAIFESRFHTLLDSDSLWSTTFRKPLLLFNYCLTGLLFLPTYLNVPEQKSTLAMTFEKVSNEYNLTSCVVLTTDIRYFAIPVGIMTVFTVLESFVFIGAMNRLMTKRSKTMTVSQATYKIKKKFVRAIYTQVLILFVIINIPINYFITAVKNDYHNQLLNNICFIIFSIHGLVSTLLLITIHKPYWDFCKFFLLCGKKTEPIRVLSVTSKTSEFRV